ncbi:MAG: hypothetical protein ACOCT0_01740 [Halobacteriota archaeon]
MTRRACPTCGRVPGLGATLPSTGAADIIQTRRQRTVKYAYETTDSTPDDLCTDCRKLLEPTAGGTA